MSEQSKQVAPRAQEPKLELGNPYRLDPGKRKDRPVVLAFEHAVSLARQGAYVAGWLADPADQLESLFVAIDGGSSIEPLGSNRSGRRADARTRLEPKLRGLKIGLHELREPEFCCFIPATGVATSQSGRATATLKSGGSKQFALPLADTLGDVFDLLRRAGWPAVAPEIMRISVSSLTPAWRDALRRYRWLLPAQSKELAELTTYLEDDVEASHADVQDLGDDEPTKSRGAHEQTLPPYDLPPQPPTEEMIAEIQRSGLFDQDHYLSFGPETRSAELGPIGHFCEQGWREGRQPNAYFDTEWYLRTYEDVAGADLNPLWHYAFIGEKEGRRPSLFFDPEYYGRAYSLGGPSGALADYLDHVGRREWRNPVERFDVDYYLSKNRDVEEAGVDPVLHYFQVGHAEHRNPSEDFNSAYYRERHLGGDEQVNPLAHFLEGGGREQDTHPLAAEDAHAGSLQHGIAEEVRRWANPGDAFEEFDPHIAAGRAPQAKVVAFYLPQFHAIPENDVWWGKGFTEWRNVMRGVPRFPGHYQPRIPRDLGAYDLSDVEVMRQQADLARKSGIHGFAYYYYWFNGQRLLERPVEQFLAEPSIEFPFCLIWANENWTRRWDGGEDQVLMRQEYDPDDDAPLVDDIQRHFADPRYIRIDGRPLLLVYRLDVIPKGRRTVRRWRELWKDRHGEEPLIFLAQTFGAEDPRHYGLDGAIEFPPHKLAATSQTLSPLNSRSKVFDPGFEGTVHDYELIARRALDDPYPDFPLAKTVVPSWDNDARRQGAGMTLHGSTPERYETWLRGAIETAKEHPVFGEPLVFVNAWNEWAEAAYLEPDVHFGAAYLNATARAVCGSRQRTGRMKILLAGHDAQPFGAQINVRHQGDTMKNQFGCEVAWLLRTGGPMVSDLSRQGKVTVTDDDPVATSDRLEELRDDGYELAITNTVGSGTLVPYLKGWEFSVVSLVHELPGVIEENWLWEPLRNIAEGSDKVVLAADAVRGAIAEIEPAVRDKAFVRPQGLYNEIDASDAAGTAAREELGIPADARVVLNVGAGDLRKGIDIFLHVAKLAVRRRPDLHFVWVGKPHLHIARWLKTDISGELGSRVHLVPFTEDIAPFFAAADVFFLSSREDPFPTVVLEALHAGLPIVVLQGSGGMDELAAEHGTVVDGNDLDAVVEALHDAATETDPESSEHRSRMVSERFRWDEYCFDLLKFCDPGLKKVSVVVPNYNYDDYLEGRMMSLFDQTYPIFEIIALDDASSDQSIDELERVREQTGRHFRVVSNDHNSGSAFHQWARACELARGDFLWIAEADDLSKPEFLEAVIRAMGDDVAFAFSDSSQIDEKGRTLGDSYKDYYRRSAGELMQTDFVLEGEAFVRNCLAERNLVLNVSSVVWNLNCLKQTLAGCLDELLDYKLGGDWHLYAAAALAGRNVAYISEPLNIHRRHDESVTGSLDKGRHLDEVRRVHTKVAEWLHAGADDRARMEAYETELESQFGLR